MANLNIKDIAVTDLDFFNSLKTENKTSKEVIALLITSYKNQVTQQPSEGNLNLQNQLNEVNQTLEAVTLQLTEKEIELTALLIKVTELEAQQIKEPDFVVTPNAKIAEAINLIQPGFYKKNLTKNTNLADYKNELAKYAIRYLAQNEFKNYLLV